MNVDRLVFWTSLVCGLLGCAMPPAKEPVAPRVYELGGVTTRYLAADAIDRECEARMHNGKTHWGCATYDRARRHCEILVQPVRHKLDWDRAALLGIEFRNCLLIEAGEPD